MQRPWLALGAVAACGMSVMTFVEGWLAEGVATGLVAVLLTALAERRPATRRTPDVDVEDDGPHSPPV